jgi:ABC-type sugar transport system ATPase subunit
MLELRNVSKIYADKKVVDNLSMYINKGESLIITGPSGSGKSTLLRMITGLEMVSSGEIILNNNMISSNKYILNPNERNMSFVFQSAALWPHMTVKENIMFAINNLTKSEAEHKVNSLLEIAEIMELKNRYPNEISGGEARRVSILRAIASDKEIFFLDEPLTNLNMDLKYKLLDFILDIVKTMNKTMIYVTHDLDEADRIQGRKFIMEKGILKER